MHVHPMHMHPMHMHPMHVHPMHVHPMQVKASIMHLKSSVNEERSLLLVKPLYADIEVCACRGAHVHA